MTTRSPGAAERDDRVEREARPSLLAHPPRDRSARRAGRTNRLRPAGRLARRAVRRIDIVGDDEADPSPPNRLPARSPSRYGACVVALVDSPGPEALEVVEIAPIPATTTAGGAGGGCAEGGRTPSCKALCARLPTPDPSLPGGGEGARLAEGEKWWAWQDECDPRVKAESALKSVGFMICVLILKSHAQNCHLHKISCRIRPLTDRQSLLSWSRGSNPPARAYVCGFAF